MARPYSSQDGTLFDSNLQLKIEHERLTRQVAELRREEAEIEMALQRQTSDAPVDLGHRFDEALS
jgi:hypothetical protein